MGSEKIEDFGLRDDGRISHFSEKDLSAQTIVRLIQLQEVPREIQVVKRADNRNSMATLSESVAYYKAHKRKVTAGRRFKLRTEQAAILTRQVGISVLGLPVKALASGLLMRQTRSLRREMLEQSYVAMALLEQAALADMIAYAGEKVLPGIDALIS